MVGNCTILRAFIFGSPHTDPEQSNVKKNFYLRVVFEVIMYTRVHKLWCCEVLQWNFSKGTLL